MPPSSHFPASYDRTTKIISGVVLALMLGVTIATQSALAAGILLLTVVFSYGLSPRGYTVAERSILVHRMLWNARLPLEGARQARPISGDELRGSFRVFGSGGLFGYYGLFHTSKLGGCTWFVTARERLVVVITDAKSALFSPDDPDGFLAAVRTEASLPHENGPVPSLGKIPRTGMWVGIGVGVAALALVAAAMLYSPGPPKYAVDEDSISVDDFFYAVTVRASDVDVDHIRVVDVGHDPEWRITMRTNGFSNAHYHSGWYRVAGGAKVRMYRTDSTRLVLIPPRGGGAAVLLQTAEPEAFAAELQRRWTRP
jgi:hypothetical protein